MTIRYQKPSTRRLHVCSDCKVKPTLERELSPEGMLDVTICCPECGKTSEHGVCAYKYPSARAALAACVAPWNDMNPHIVETKKKRPRKKARR